MLIYANVEKCRLGFCPGLRLHLFRIASGGLIYEPFLHADFLAACQLVQLLPVRYPYKRLFDVLRLFAACMCVLSAAKVKLILGTFTGLIMALNYYIYLNVIF